MKNQQTRRDALKNIASLSGGLFIYSCSVSEDETGEPIITINKPKQEKKVIDTLEIIEEKIESSNVIYIEPNDERYDKLRQGFNLRFDKKPKIIALPKNTLGVSEAIKRANIEQLKIAVKSGGHSFEGFSSINNGLQINLSLLNEFSLNKNLLTAGPACLLKELYDFILPKGRILPAGSCGTVGLGGLALGGGYGFFARKHGLTCDNIISMDFVDGNGDIHSTKTDEELSWALKGGGNGNFGVVTKFTFKTHEAPSHFTRHRFKAYKLDKERTKELLSTYFEFADNLPQSCFAAFVLNYKTMVLLITNYGDDNENLDAMVNKFSEIADKAEIGTKKDLAKSLRNYYGVQYPIYFKNASAGYYNGFSDIETSIDQVLDKVFNKRGLIYQINTLGGAINTPEFEESSSYPHRSFNYLSELQAYWDKPKQEKYLTTTFQEIQDILFDNGIKTQYRNYPSLGFENWQEAYYGENYEKLQKIKATYDPNNLFSNKQSIESN